MMEKIIGLAIIVMSLDFIQESLCGTIKALCQQNKAMIINFISYYVIIIPLAYYFAFMCTNKQLLYIFQGGPDSETEAEMLSDKPGLGMVGIWLGFITGMLH
jgi:Na+-driven multidrug efflux pump